MPCSTNRLKPTGGVICAVSTVMTRKMPNHSGSMPLGNGDAVKLTTARYYTPSGRSIQARGIDPDVALKPDSSAPTLVSTTPGYTEATLPGHLRGDEEDGSAAGDVLDGDGPINAALAELKKPKPAVAAAPAATPAPTRN